MKLNAKPRALSLLRLRSGRPALSGTFPSTLTTKYMFSIVEVRKLAHIMLQTVPQKMKIIGLLLTIFEDL